MYTAKIITDEGKTFDFSYKNGVLFDISPLSGLSVGVSTSQGFQQIGQTVEYLSVGGISRTIRGHLLSRDAAQRMVSVLSAFTSGKLYVQDRYYATVVISSTPEIIQKKTGDIRFTMRVFCSSPFWYAKNNRSVILNDYTPSFSFPVLYDSHTFGTKSNNKFQNVYNSGDIAADMEVTFTSDGDATGYGIANVLTGEVLQFDDTISSGDTVILRKIGGRITAKKTSGGQETDILRTISDESTLFSLSVGDNILRVIADDGENVLHAMIDYNEAYMGVVV